MQTVCLLKPRPRTYSNKLIELFRALQYLPNNFNNSYHLSRRYVRFIPAVWSKFKWTAPNELVFSPARAFEVENPRLTEARDMPWITKPTTPDHFDLRDDRINFYTTVTGTEHFIT